MNNRLLVSLMIIGFVGAGLGGTTMAMFNDTETSENNEFTAGELDLKIDWEESYNGEQVETQELTNNPGRIFNLSDIKPGDHGEATVSLHLDDNPGWIWMNMNQTANKENGCTEPEAEVDETCGDPGHGEGELGEELEFVIWADDGDNVRQEDEHIIFEGTAHELEEESLEEGILLDGNPSTNETEAFPGKETSYVGIKWKVPLETGNHIQGDSKKFDISFYTEQRRHNDDPENPWSGEEPKDNQTPPVDDEPESDFDYYQVDFVGGEPIENLSESTYHSEDRMQRYIHGGPGVPKDNESEPDQVKRGTVGVDCVDSEPFEVDTEEDTATVEFEVLNNTPECATSTRLSLVSYEKPYPGWIQERAGEQRIFDNKTVKLDPGMHSLTVDIPDVNDPEENGDEPEGEEPSYTASQGEETTEIEPLSGDKSVEELYDFRLPDRFDHDNQAQNGATYGSGPTYQSVGTEDLQRESTSIMFLYDGPEGLSLVVVQGKAGGDGGSATFDIAGLSDSGEWVVKDDLYLQSDGTKAGSNYDNWNVDSDPQTIDWTWGGGGTDGGAFSPLSEDFNFTITPHFNEDSELYEQFYNGDVTEWQVLSGDMDNPDRTTLDMEEEVTVAAE